MRAERTSDAAVHILHAFALNGGKLRLNRCGGRFRKVAGDIDLRFNEIRFDINLGLHQIRFFFLFFVVRRVRQRIHEYLSRILCAHFRNGSAVSGRRRLARRLLFLFIAL